MSELPEIGREDAMACWLASLHGNAALALELERLGISDPEDSLENATKLRPMLLEAVERELAEARERNR